MKRIGFTLFLSIFVCAPLFAQAETPPTDWNQYILYGGIALAVLIAIFILVKMRGGNDSAPQQHYTSVPQDYNTSGPFHMVVTDVFSISGRGAVVTGVIDKGECHVGEEITVDTNGVHLRTTITGIEMFRKTLKTAKAGDNVGILLKGLDKNKVARGSILSK